MGGWRAFGRHTLGGGLQRFLQGLRARVSGFGLRFRVWGSWGLGLAGFRGLWAARRAHLRGAPLATDGQVDGGKHLRRAGALLSLACPGGGGGVGVRV